MPWLAAKRAFGGLLLTGVVDPAQATRLALYSAAPTAGRLRITDGRVADAPEPMGTRGVPALAGGSGSDC